MKKIMVQILLLLPLTLGWILSGCGSHDSPREKAYIESVNRWHAQRIARLKRKDSWLTLAGLFWLQEGENSFGAAQDNRIRFPAGKADSHIGVLVLKDSSVTIRVFPGVEVTDTLGNPVREGILRDDSRGKPTILKHRSLLFYIIKRGKRFAVRLKDTEHPNLKKFTGIERFPVDPRWRVRAVLKPFPTPRTVPIPTVLGTIVNEPTPGVLEFTIRRQKYYLTPLGKPGDAEYFIIFGDETNGEETYGAGRFLEVPAPDSSGVTFIDFNKAYNPPCAFTPYATCPLPPEENELPIRVTAGEKNYHGASHHSSTLQKKRRPTE